MQPGEQRRLSVSCSFRNVRRISAFVRDCCDGFLPESDAAQVELAVAEAANNIASHSYRDSEGWPLEIAARLRESRLEILLADGGLPFNPDKVPEPSFDWSSIEEVPEHGRGLFLIKSIMEDLRFLRCGEINLCFMAKSIPATPGSGRRGQQAGDESPIEMKSSFLCDCADPFALASPKDSPEFMAAASCQLPPMKKQPFTAKELSMALSLRTDASLAMKRMAKLLLDCLRAKAVAIWMRRRGALELAASEGDSASFPPEIDFPSEEIEAQCAAQCAEMRSGKRICIPLSGIGKLLGVATLLFDSDREAKAADSTMTPELLSLVSTGVENIAIHAKALDAERSRKEMETAATLHKGVVSTLIPNMPSLMTYAKSQSAMEVGGDYLSFRKESDSALWFMVCDAMGKGMSASFFSILSHMTFQSVLFIQDKISPGELLTKSNQIMAGDFDRFEMFMTAFVGKIDLKEGTLQYASAGHCPPIIYRPEEGVSLLFTQDYMLGVSPEMVYETFSVPFVKGSRLVAYTDGLTDIVGPDGEMVGVDPLLDACAQSFKTMNVVKACESIFSNAIAASKGTLQDDITLIGLEHL